MNESRPDDPNVCFWQADPVTLWTIGVVEWRVDTRNHKFIITPIMRGCSEGPSIDATEMYERYSREQRR
jgi:hypothetical protein